MEVTTDFTMENWRTQEIEMHEIPEEVLSLSFSEILEKAFTEIGSVDLNPVELLFSCIFLHEGWRVVRTPMGRENPVHRHTSIAIERATGVEEALYGTGVPDLFLWTQTGQFRFVEIKASEDCLNENQRDWANQYDLELFVAQLAPESDDLSSEEILEKNRIT